MSKNILDYLLFWIDFILQGIELWLAMSNKAAQNFREGDIISFLRSKTM